jgi:hypothetical protein
MATLHTKVKKYLEANSKTDAELYNGNIELVDEGSGPYIRTWNVDGVTKPTDSQIASYETAGDEEEALTKILVKRKKEYLSWNEQLDKLYHDINDGKLDKTGSWYTHIKAVKDANSKE